MNKLKFKPDYHEPHETVDSYCCACEYDIAGFKAQLEIAYEKGRSNAFKEATEVLKKIFKEQIK